MKKRIQAEKQTTPSNELSVLLEAFLNEPESLKAEACLANLLAVANPLIRATITNQIRASVEAWNYWQIVDDLISETVTKLLGVLQKRKEVEPEKYGVKGDFQFYVLAVTRNVCKDYLRRRYPQIRSLQDQLRYLLSHDPELAVWENEHGTKVCGLRVWQLENQASVKPEQWDILTRQYISGNANPKHSVADFTKGILKQAQAPVPFALLTSLVMTWTGIRQRDIHLSLDDETISEQPIQDKQAIETEQKQYLFTIWRHIKQLSVMQRRALLLNLSDGQDRGLITSFVELGVTTVKELAEVLDVSTDFFWQLWEALPMDDLKIAELFGVTRQQVLNHRFAARKSLTKNLGR